MKKVAVALALVGILLMFTGAASAQQLMSLNFLGLNVGKVPLEVRKAIAHAIDRDTLFSSPPAGFMPANTIQPPGMVGHNPSLKGYQLDREKAKEVLGDRKFQGELWVVDTEQRGNVAQSIAQSVGSLGIALNVVRFSQAADMIARLNRGEGTMWILSLVPNRDAPLVRTIVSADLAPRWYSFRDEQFTAMLSRAAAETDQSKATELYQQLEQRVIDEVLVVPLYFMPVR
jgi:dipeptide transport system substrate-binding protein